MNGEGGRWFNWASLLVGIVAMAAGVAGFMLQTRSNEPQVRFRILNATELTSVHEIAGLTAEFKYRDSTVKHLWKLNARIENTGNCTLIGSGSRKSLIGDVIKFEFPPESKVLDQQVTNNDFSGNFRMLDDNSLAIGFEQWRKMEKADLALFIETTAGTKQAPQPTSSRDIVDGLILIEDMPPTKTSDTRPLLDHLPTPLALIVKVVSSVVCALFGGMFLLMAVLGAKNFLRLRDWKLNNWHGFKRFIASAEAVDLTEAQRSKFLSFPYQTTDATWRKFDGERLDLSASDFVFDSWKQAVFITMFFVPLGAGIVAFVLSAWWRL